MDLVLDFCGGSDSDPPHESQQPSRNPERICAGPEGSCQSHFFTWTNLDGWLLYLGTSEDSSALLVLWTEHPARLLCIYFFPIVETLINYGQSEPFVRRHCATSFKLRTRLSICLVMLMDGVFRTTTEAALCLTSHNYD